MINISTNYKDNSELDFEIVEKKSFGHPDNLADNLAKLCSIEYSKYCLDNFGYILHHNFDKLYIGAGSFTIKDKKVKTKSKIKIVLNGRASTSFANQKINLKKVLNKKIEEYLTTVMPAINFKKDVKVIYNANNFSQRKNWYTPKSVDDIPDAKVITSGDTSVCVVNTGESNCEKLCKEIENIFFKRTKFGFASPIYEDLGQDIKIMITRIKNEIDITICLPVFATRYETFEEYSNILKHYEKIVEDKISPICKEFGYSYTLNINKKQDGSFRIYKTFKGSCIDCGEEGVVGRGNNSRGLISVFNPHTMEAPFGKNERYHTGRVLDFLCRKLGDKILETYNAKSRIFCVARNQNPLLEPYVFNISLNIKIDNEKIEQLAKEIFTEKYLMENILTDTASV